MLSNRYRYSWYLDTLLLIFLFGGLYFTLLGSRPLFVPDEGRYAEIAREMVALGDYVTPYLNGVKYFEKPILFYWLGAAAIKLGGLNLWSIRSINALLGLLCGLFTYFTARKLYDRETGLLAALILGTSALYFVMSHMISLDITVTSFLTISLYAFLLGTHQPLGTKRRLYLWMAFAFAGFAVLTKGLIGIVFPCLIIGAWLVRIGEYGLIKRLYLPSSILIFLAITVPWHMLVGERNPEFFYFYFIEQHFLRYATPDIGHYQPVWFFLPVLLIGFFPWSVFLPQALFNQSKKKTDWKDREENKIDWFFILWAAIIFVFFSFSKSKLIPYILPVLPPLAILVARYLISCIKTKQKLGIKIAYAILFLMSLPIAYQFFLFPQQTLLTDSATAACYLNLASLVLLIGSGVACFFAFRHIKQAILTTLATSCLFLLLGLSAMPAIDTRSIQPLADILNPILHANDEVITYNQYYQDLPFYLQRRVSILNWQNELKFGMHNQNNHDWMLDDDAFWQHWHSDKRVFVVMANKEYEQVKVRYPTEQFHLLGETPNNVLLANRFIEQKLSK